MPHEKWTDEEDALIRTGFAKFGHLHAKWAAIKKEYFSNSSRTSSHIRRHWDSIDPEINKGGYSAEERKQIVSLVQEGKEFTNIAKILSVPGGRRTTHSVQNLYMGAVVQLERAASGPAPCKPRSDKGVPRGPKAALKDPDKRPRTQAPAAEPENTSFAARDKRARAAGVTLIDPVALLALLKEAKQQNCGPQLEGYDLVGAARKMLAPEPRSPLEQIDQNTSGASLDDDDSETLGAPLLECAADLLDKVPQEDDDAELEDLDDKTALELAVSMMLEEDMPCKDRPVVETEGADMAVDMCM